MWLARSCTCARTITSGRTSSRCTSSATTTLTSPSPVCGGSCIASTWAACPPHSATMPTIDAGNASRKPLPGHRVQIDVKFIEPIAGQRPKRYYQYTAIDDCTRIRVLRIYPKNNQQSAIRFLDYVLEKLPFQVEVIQTDNGSEFQAAV
jgi:hypothetical protein